MALRTVLTSMQLENGEEMFVEVSLKAIDYFGIVVTAPKIKVIDREAYTYYRGSLSASDTKSKIEVPRSRFPVVPKIGRRDCRKIRVPREEISRRGNVRNYTFSFPKRVLIWEISDWLWQHCNRHKPLYFLTESGRYRTVREYSRYLTEGE